MKAIAVASGYSTQRSWLGSLHDQPAAATPTFSPAAGTYTPSQTVTISDATLARRSTTPPTGTTPTTGSTSLSGADHGFSDGDGEGHCGASGYSNSAIGSAAYTITAAATPTFSPAAGSYRSAQTVTISDATSGATIYYTTNGTTPTTASTVYAGPITVSATETVEAIAVQDGLYQQRGRLRGIHHQRHSGHAQLQPRGGNVCLGANGDHQRRNLRRDHLLHHQRNDADDCFNPLLQRIKVSVSETVMALAVKPGYTNSAIGSAVYTINPPPAIATIAGVQAGTTNPTTGMVAHGNSIGAPEGVAVAPVINGGGR